MTDASLELRELCKRFPLGGGLFSPKKELHAVNNVSLLLPPGQTLGLVGADAPETAAFETRYFFSAFEIV